MTAATRASKIRTVVVTRSKEGNRELSSRLQQMGLTPVAVDSVSIAPPKDWSSVDAILGRLKSFDWLVFTSINGVGYFARRMNELGLGPHWEGRPLVAAVGRRTADGVSALLMKRSFVPSSFLTSRLAEELPTDSGRKVTLLRADIADPRFSERLSERGFLVEEASIYETVSACAVTDHRVSQADAIVFASSSAVRGLCGALPREELTRLFNAIAFCIGPVTASAAKERGFTNTVVPESYTLEAVVKEIARMNQDA